MSSTDKVTSTPAPVHGFWRAGAIRAAALGVASWLLAVLIIHYGLQAGLFEGWSRIGLYGATAALTWAGFALASRSASSDDLMAAVCMATATAAFCDVAAMTWAPGLYGATAAEVLAGAVWILWGVGCALSLAFVRAR